MHPTHHLHISTGFAWALLMFLFLIVVAVFWHRWLKRQDELACRRLELDHEVRLEHARRRDVGATSRSVSAPYESNAPGAATSAPFANLTPTYARSGPAPAPAPAYGGGYSGGELAGAMLLGGVVGAALESGGRDTVIVEASPTFTEPSPVYDNGPSFDSGVSYDSGSSYDDSGSSGGFDLSW